MAVHELFAYLCVKNAAESRGQVANPNVRLPEAARVLPQNLRPPIVPGRANLAIPSAALVDSMTETRSVPTERRLNQRHPWPVGLVFNSPVRPTT